MGQTPPYILVVGHGRSGTNWLLDILDASDLTHCRNEPNEVSDAALKYVERFWYSASGLDTAADQWERQVAIAKISMSERDHRISTPKTYIYPLSFKLGLSALPARPKIRKLLSMFFPQFTQGEWRLPEWIGSCEQLSQATAVFKINMLAAWFVKWHADQYPQVPILHIVRHPKGYFNSSWRRFFSRCSSAELEDERNYYIAMLKTAVQLEPQWRDGVGNLELLNVLEAVAWFWRINNEMIYSTCRSLSHYRLITYEELVQLPLKRSQDLYDFCRLPWSAQVELNIRQGLGDSVWGALERSPQEIANAWTTQLSHEHSALIDQVFEGSLMQHWWSSQDKVAS